MKYPRSSNRRCGRLGAWLGRIFAVEAVANASENGLG